MLIRIDMNLKSIIRRWLVVVNGIFRRDRSSRVLFYHDVSGDTIYTDMTTDINIFKSHINTIICNGFDIVPTITNPENQVQICFDDGFRGIWDCRHYFYENNLRPTIFIADSLIGQEGYLTIEEIKELYAHGFLFEAHTCSHTNLTNYTESALRDELSQSLRHLRDITGIDIKDLCFPQGFYSDTVIRVAKECGYRKLYSSDPGPYFNVIHTMLVPRYLLQDATRAVVRSTLFGGQDFLFSHYSKYHKKHDGA